MSQVAKKPDALENIKKLKGFEAGELSALGAKTKVVRQELESVTAKMRLKFEETKARQAEAAIALAAEKARLEKQEQEVKAAEAAAQASQADSLEQVEPQDTVKKPSKPKKATVDVEIEVQADSEQANAVKKGAKKVVAEQAVEAEDATAIIADEQKADPSNEEKSLSQADKKPKQSDTKKRVAEFFDRNETEILTLQKVEDALGAAVLNKPIVEEPKQQDKKVQAESADTSQATIDTTEEKDAKQAEKVAVSAEEKQDGRPARSAAGQPRQQQRGASSYSASQDSGRDMATSYSSYQGRQDNRFEGRGQQPQQGWGQRSQGGPPHARLPYQTTRPGSAAGAFGKSPRPGGPPVPRLGPPGRAPLPVIPQDNRSRDPQKKKPIFDDKRGAMTKKALIQRGYVVEDIAIGEDGEIIEGRAYRARKGGAKRHEFIQPSARIESAVVNEADIPIKTLGEKIGRTAAEIVKKCFILGFPKTINESVDFDTAELIAGEFGITLTLKLEKTFEEVLETFDFDEETSDQAEWETRPPVVTIMGHVDHGKTSLLDFIRKANVAMGEAGGITQHIGAYSISLEGKAITFLDTPGHEAFTAMRARGAQVTDIAILVVAADDGVMPQTIEAINHAKAAGVSIIVAINKIDKPTADPGRIKTMLSEHGLLPEEWGGDIPMIGVSAKTGEGVNSLLENILTLAEIKELKANPKRAARGTIIESKLDKGRGAVATILVQNGTLKIADTIVAGTAICRVRAMIDEKGKNVTHAGPSMPVSVLGFDMVPEAGESIFAVADEKLAKQVAGERSDKLKTQKQRTSTKMSLEDVYKKISAGLIKDLNLIVKGDVHGSVEALIQALSKISNEEVRVNIIHSGVGAINESDIMLAGTSSAIIIGFNVRPDAKAKVTAEKEDIDIRVYRIIYDAIEDVEKAIKGMLAPKFKEVVLGSASVRQVFKVTGAGTIAGCMVVSGKVTSKAKLRLLRDSVIIHEGSVASLKRFKEDAKEVATGFECGIGIEGYNDIKEADVIEAFIMEQIEV